MVHTLCEVCQAKPSNHWSGIVCEDCEDWLLDNDTESVPIWDGKHRYHSAAVDSWIREIRRIYRGEDEAENEVWQESQDESCDA